MDALHTSNRMMVNGFKTMANAPTVILQSYVQCPRQLLGQELGEDAMGTTTQAGKSSATKTRLS